MKAHKHLFNTTLPNDSAQFHSQTKWNGNRSSITFDKDAAVIKKKKKKILFLSCVILFQIKTWLYTNGPWDIMMIAVLLWLGNDF